MSRPTKQGLDYFSFDVDFYDNLKIRKIMRACGPGAGSILTCLLCNIYRNKGYYIEWNEDLPFDIADKVGVSEGAVSEVITKALQVYFFDDQQFQQNRILTSEEIQKRYKAGTAKRLDVIIDESFIVIGGRKRVNGGNNSVNGAGNTQSKVKESTGNETKVKQGAKALVVADATNEGKRRESEKKYKELVQELTGKDVRTVWTGLKEFILADRPEIIDPYQSMWNLFAESYKLSKVEVMSDSRRKKFKTRVAEPGFDFVKILECIKTSSHLRGDNKQNWAVTFDWVFENDKNYLKIIEGNYN